MYSFLSLLISVIALMGSFSSWLYIWYLNRVNFSLEICSKHMSPKGILLYVCFTNKSRLPVSITKISLLHCGLHIQCNPIPKLVFSSTSKTGDRITNEEKHYSISIPINLNPLSASSGYLYFPSVQETFLQNTSVLAFEVQTNRGVIKKMTLELPRENLH